MSQQTKSVIHHLYIVPHKKLSLFICLFKRLMSLSLISFCSGYKLNNWTRSPITKLPYITSNACGWLSNGAYQIGERNTFGGLSAPGGTAANRNRPASFMPFVCCD